MLEEEIVKKLLEKQYTVTTAESCTGGLLAGRILNVPGASSVYNEGHITYSNEAKEKNLGVLHTTLEAYGAVSRQTAEQMAEGVRKRAGATYGLATTGIAGPDGGTEDKPVGLVYIACAGSKKTLVKECHFSGGRQSVRRQATEMVLQLLLTCIKELNC
mgnify:CR=1 FL=1